MRRQLSLLINLLIKVAVCILCLPLLAFFIILYKMHKHMYMYCMLIWLFALKKIKQVYFYSFLFTSI